ncbi:MAG: restriction endonuclease subunit S [Ruminococcus sp.]
MIGSRSIYSCSYHHCRQYSRCCSFNAVLHGISPFLSFISSDIFRSLTAYRTRYHIGAGSTFVEVSGKQIANMDLMMPTTIEEQQKIGSYFRNLDHLITLHQRKL